MLLNNITIPISATVHTVFLGRKKKTVNITCFLQNRLILVMEICACAKTHAFSENIFICSVLKCNLHCYEYQMEKKKIHKYASRRISGLLGNKFKAFKLQLSSGLYKLNISEETSGQ